MSPAHCSRARVRCATTTGGLSSEPATSSANRSGSALCYSALVNPKPKAGRYRSPSSYKRNRHSYPCSNIRTFYFGSASAAIRH